MRTSGSTQAGAFFVCFANRQKLPNPRELLPSTVEPSENLARTSVPARLLTYIADQEKFERGAMSMVDRVEREDEAIVENVQRGVRSRLYKNGRYSPTREKGTHHFHQLIAEFMK
jgi:choline monooxygenase